MGTSLRSDPSKSDAEAHPYLSPNDEYANFETWDQGNLRMEPKEKYASRRIRSAKKRFSSVTKFGVNLFKFGLVGGKILTMLCSDDENFMENLLTTS